MILIQFVSLGQHFFAIVESLAEVYDVLQSWILKGLLSTEAAHEAMNTIDDITLCEIFGGIFLV